MIFEAVERIMDLISKSWVRVFFWPFLAKRNEVKLLIPSQFFLIFQIGIIIIEQTVYCMSKCFVKAIPV